MWPINTKRRVLQRRLGSTKNRVSSKNSVTGLIHRCDVNHSHVWRDSYVLGDVLQRQLDSTKNRVSSKNYVTWLIHVCDMTQSHVWHDSMTCVTWLNHMCDMTHSYWEVSISDGLASTTVWQRQSRVSNTNYVGWLIYVYEMTQSHVWHSAVTLGHVLHRRFGSVKPEFQIRITSYDSSLGVTWLDHMCDLTHSHVWYDSCICVTWLIHMCDMTNS